MNSPVTGEFPTQRPVTRSFDVFFDLRLNKRLSKQWWGWWFETPSRPWWRHCNENIYIISLCFVLLWSHIYPSVFINVIYPYFSWLLQRRWANPQVHWRSMKNIGNITPYPTTTKHRQAQSMCLFLEIYCKCNYLCYAWFVVRFPFCSGTIVRIPCLQLHYNQRTRFLMQSPLILSQRYHSDFLRHSRNTSYEICIRLALLSLCVFH